MIKKYKQFESLLDKMQGPDKDEILSQFKQMNPNDALMKCVHKNTGFLEGVKQALEDGAEINKKDPKLDLTALEYAIENNYIEIAIYLIDNGAIISNNYAEFFLLKIAVHSNLETFKYALKKIDYPLGSVSAKKILTNSLVADEHFKDFLEKYISDIEKIIKNYIKTI